jgi:hypothetical protein
VIEIGDQRCESRDLDVEVVLDGEDDGVLDGESQLALQGSGRARRGLAFQRGGAAGLLCRARPGDREQRCDEPESSENPHQFPSRRAR